MSKITKLSKEHPPIGIGTSIEGSALEGTLEGFVSFLLERGFSVFKVSTSRTDEVTLKFLKARLA